MKKRETSYSESFERPFTQKIFFTITTIRNWYMLPFDKLGIFPKVIYKLKGGLFFVSRSKSTDINEMVAIMSGLIYPTEFCVVKNGDTVVDLGASCGEFVLFTRSINKNVRFKGFAVEPYEPNIAALKENVKINSIKNFTIVPFAVSDKNKNVFLNTSTTFDTIQISDTKTSTKVDALTFTGIAQKYNIQKIALLKVDIEGHEYEVFEQSYKFIAKTTKKILIEYHNLSKSKNYKALMNKFKDDFTITHYIKAAHGGILCLKNKALR
jgi:FkbM family methyltransferase